MGEETIKVCFELAAYKEGFGGFVARIIEVSEAIVTKQNNEAYFKGTFDSSQKGVSSLSRTTTSKADPDTYNMGGDNAEITLFVTLKL